MEKDYDQLEKEFNKKIVELKKNCKHKELTGWCEQWWAMGHPTGFMVKACKRCREIIKKKTTCMKCGKMTEHYIEGDGKTFERPMGEYLCKKCDAIKKQEDKTLPKKEREG